MTMSGIFNNGIDSLKLGIKFYINNEIETAHKHAILNIFHSIELFLKEKLYKIHPLLIYEDIDKPIGDHVRTVGLEKIIIRYKNIGSPLGEKNEKILIDLKKKRNKIEHHQFNPEDSDFSLIGKALKFLYYFLPEQLDCSMEDHLDVEIYKKMREIILEYEVRLTEAEEKVKEETTAYTKDDLCSITCSTSCPECGNDTVVVDGKKGDFCYFCYKEVDISQCERCQGYFPSNEIEEVRSFCENCEKEAFDKF